MDLYSINMIKSDLSLGDIYYIANQKSHSESIYIEQISKDGKVTKNYIAKDLPISEVWLRFLDFGAEKDFPIEECFEKIKDTFKVLTENIPRNQEDSLLLFKDVTKILKPVIADCPVLTIVYPYFYNVLKGCYKKDDVKKEISTLKQVVSSLNKNYDSAHEYAKTVLLLPDAKNKGRSPQDLIIMHSAYCNINQKEDYYYNTIPLAIPNNVRKGSSWETFLDQNAYETNEEEKCFKITSLEQFLHIGIDIMKESKTIIRKCKNCGGYFKVKYYLPQPCCTRIYRNTKYACYEHAQQKTYKQKLFAHPIHQEFTKAYNRLYGRIRRGRVPEDTPLMDELKALHDEYVQRYNETHKKEREKVWKEYIKKNKELLG